MGDIRPLVAGNWKMNGLRGSADEIKHLVEALGAQTAECDVMICPPSPVLALYSDLKGDSRLQLGGQDCHENVSGAHTGDISAEMLKDAGASAVIVGHSERRTDHQETNEQVMRKALAAFRAELTAIICVGETQEERDQGKTLDKVGEQIRNSIPDTATATNTIIAYEPVWAIGTGLTPTPKDVLDVHTFIRSELVNKFKDDGAKMRILYGGSVKPSNADELMGIDEVNGALVGGASLKAADFLGIIAAYN